MYPSCCCGVLRSAGNPTLGHGTPVAGWVEGDIAELIECPEDEFVFVEEGSDDPDFGLGLGAGPSADADSSVTGSSVASS